MPEATPTPAPAAAPPLAAATPAASPSSPSPQAAAPAATPAAASSPAPAAAGETPAPPAVIESLIGGPAPAPVDPNAPPAEVKPAEPQAYEIKLPDGIEADPALLDSARAIFTEAKIAPEVAQRLATFHGEQMQALTKALKDQQVEVWNSTIRGWQEQVISDKTIGGANWTASKAAIEGGLQTAFGVTPTTPANAPERAAHKAFVDALAMTGAGSNPAIIRGLHKMVATRSEGRPAPVGGPSAPKKSPVEKMYGNQQAAE